MAMTKHTQSVIALLFIMALVSFAAWRLYDYNENGPAAQEMKCTIIANHEKQGGITYDELKYKREHCDLY